MSFVELERFLKDEYGMNLHELLYKVDYKKRDFILRNLDKDIFFNNSNYYNNLIGHFINKERFDELYTFLRYYSEFPYFTATEIDGKIISDYRYISENIPLKLLDVTPTVHGEHSFHELSMNQNELIIKGFAYIPYVNCEQENSISKKLLVTDGTTEVAYSLKNRETEETLQAGKGIYYYSFAGIEERIDITEQGYYTCYLELTSASGVTTKEYCFEIDTNEGNIYIDVKKLTHHSYESEQNAIEPELLFTEISDNNINLFIEVNKETLSKLSSSPNEKVKIMLSGMEINHTSVIEKDILKNGIMFLNVPVIQFEIDSSLLTDEGKSYVLFESIDKKYSVKSAESFSYILDKYYCEDTNRFISIFANRKNNIELHVGTGDRADFEPNKTKNVISKFLRVIKTK